MTFSIVARDPATGDLGIAIASRALGVGAVAPFARAGVGAISTQAMPNVAYRPDGLERLAAGEDPEAVLAALTAADSMASQRQAGIVDALGRSASWTGSNCIAWAGGRTAPGVAVQGNILAGPEVLDAMLAAWETSTGTFPRRLLAALRAGDQAGGDSRGRQSAALLVRREKGGIGGADDRWIDLRIDDHTDPVTELGRLLALHETQTNLLDPEKLAQIGSALVRQARIVIKGSIPAPLTGVALNAIDVLPPIDNRDPAPDEAVRGAFPHGASDTSIQGAAAYMKVGQTVLRSAAEAAPKVARIVTVINDADTTVNNAMIGDLSGRWHAAAPDRTEVRHLDKALGILHDMITPDRDGQKVDVVYPILLEILTGS